MAAFRLNLPPCCDPSSGCCSISPPPRREDSAARLGHGGRDGEAGGLPPRRPRRRDPLAAAGQVTLPLQVCLQVLARPHVRPRPQAQVRAHRDLLLLLPPRYPPWGFVTADGDGGLPQVNSALSFLPASTTCPKIELLDSYNGLLLLQRGGDAETLSRIGVDHEN